MGVIYLEKFKFTNDHYTMIVDAIVEGYREYVEHRVERNNNMIISSAFAWTKGNFIESEIAENCKDIGFSFRKSKAGPTWQYLQFIDEQNKNLFLIKNAAYFDSASFTNAKIPIPGKNQGHARTYLQELAKINQHIEFPSVNKQIESQLSETNQKPLLFLSEHAVMEQLELFKSEYKSFHILTYQLNTTQEIAAVMHYLPNPADNIAYKVEDLTDFISGAELSDQDRSVIGKERNDIVDPTEFDFAIIKEEEETN